MLPTIVLWLIVLVTPTGEVITGEHETLAECEKDKAEIIEMLAPLSLVGTNMISQCIEVKLEPIRTKI